LLSFLRGVEDKLKADQVPEPKPGNFQKPLSNRSAKGRRNKLFRVLDNVLSLSHKKISSAENNDKAR
jgi:hypothetical protein